jgi:hypothetical protein
MTRILKEIRAAGYASFKQLRDDSGHLAGAEWTFSELPESENQDTVKPPQSGLPDTGNQDAVEAHVDQPATENPTAVEENISPHPEKPQPVKPYTGNPHLLNTNKQLSTDKKIITDKFSVDDFALAEQIFLKIKRSAPKLKPPNFKKWADDIRLMREQDKLTLGEIWETFLWANQDSLWSSNILSTKKLRIKFPQLDAKRRNHVNKQPNQSNSAVGRVNEAIAEKSREREQAISNRGVVDDSAGVLVQRDDGVFRV